MSEVAKHITNLCKKIRHHDRLYYSEAQPEISDLEYDKLLSELQRLEAENPSLITPDSPTQRVSGEAIGTLASVQHHIPMLSIDNTYNTQDLKAWSTRTKKHIQEAGNNDPVHWVLELKIDGVAASLIYESGLLFSARHGGTVLLVMTLRTMSEQLRRYLFALDYKSLPRKLRCVERCS